MQPLVEQNIVLAVVEDYRKKTLLISPADVRPVAGLRLKSMSWYIEATPESFYRKQRRSVSSVAATVVYHTWRRTAGPGFVSVSGTKLEYTSR